MDAANCPRSIIGAVQAGAASPPSTDRNAKSRTRVSGCRPLSLFDRRVRLYVMIHEFQPESLRIRYEKHARRRSDENRRV